MHQNSHFKCSATSVIMLYEAINSKMVSVIISYLMCIQINDHCSLDGFNLIEQKPDRKCDVSIDAEAATIV